jgi:outer membrane protein OmpA-like peptidoglycan-associated protein
LIWLGKNWPLLLVLLLLLAGILYSYQTWRSACVDSDSGWCTGHVDWQKVFPPAPPPSEPPPPQPTEPPPPEASGPAPYPSPTTPGDVAPLPPSHETHVAPPPPVAGPPPYAPPPEAPKLIAFYEGKANLTAPSLNLLRDAAMKALETDRIVHLRLDALGPREDDSELWHRRLQAVKDELVRLGVPADRIIPAGNGPFEVVVRTRSVPTTRSEREHSTMESIPDPLAGDDE